MRELLFKNLTSPERGKKVMSILETSERDGYLSRTRRHFVYMLKESQNIRAELNHPLLYILKVHDSQQKKEKLFFKVKGNFYVVSDSRVYLVYFCHSFRIELSDVAHASPTSTA